MNPRTVARWKQAGWLDESQEAQLAASRERFLALVSVDDPFWFRPLLWVVYRLPGELAVKWTQALDHWQTRRALRLYRAGKGQ